MRNLTHFLPVFLLAFVAGTIPAAGQIIGLTNGGTTVGILADVGGRIVSLSYKGSPNLLKSDTALWNEPQKDRPAPGFNTEFKAYNGHIVWLGPQGEWWAHQEGNPARKKQKANWPPDPWLIYGKYEILQRTDTSIRMMSPYSEISGLRLEKYVCVQKDGSVLFEAEGINYSRLPVRWDLWLNTRVDGYSAAYVPVKGEPSVRINAGNAGPAATVEYEISRNYFHYLPEEPGNGVQQKNSKALITPSEDWLAAFTGNYCLKITFPLYPPEQTHPQQGMVEIYDHTSHDRSDALMELEYHGPYKTLQPGEHFKTSELWTVWPYRGKNKPSRQMKFLDRVVNPQGQVATCPYGCSNQIH